MRTDVLPGTTNVVRFPTELRARPSMALLWEITPDVREVLSVAETFGLDMPVADLCDRVDADTAEHIVNHRPAFGPGRGSMLDDLLRPVVSAAVDACRLFHGLAAEATRARQALAYALSGGSTWLSPLGERADTLSRRAAEAMVAAHARSQEAAGVARAVGVARRGEIWAPRDSHADMEALMVAHRAG